jgi:hypothetical protein
MAERTTTSYEPEGGTWASGIASFGATLMIIAGGFQAATGLVALVGDNFFVPNTRGYLFELNLTTWGWVHVVLGVLLVFAGCGVLARRTWGVVVGVTMSVISAVANFAFIPYYSFWSLLIIALDVLVIWALLTYRQRTPMP